jgi:hypothetical protein
MSSHRRTSASLPRKVLRLVPLVCVALTLGACAAARGPEAARPRTNEPVYPILVAASKERREQATSTWQALAQEQGLAATVSTPELNPITATITALPPAVALRLPKVEIAKTAATSRDEATREALRRFLTSAAPLLGIAQKDLSLIEMKDEPDGAKHVRYQQKPFPFPLRAGYGVIELSVTPDDHVASLNSSALPDTERLARLLVAQPQKLAAQDAETRLKGRALTYAGATGAPLAYTVAANETVKARELVVYPVPRANDPNTLELHLAWELAVGGGGTPLLAYVDAVTGDIIATAAAATQKAQPQ